MHNSSKVMIPIPIPGLPWKPDLIQSLIPIQVKSGIILETIPILESESCTTSSG